MAADYSDVIKQAARANKQFAFLFVVTLARSPLQIGVTSTRRQLCTLPRPMLTSLTPEVLTASQMASPDDPLTLRSRLGDLIQGVYHKRAASTVGYWCNNRHRPHTSACR